jgi:hypothetical protein
MARYYKPFSYVAKRYYWCAAPIITKFVTLLKVVSAGVISTDFEGDS